MPQKFLKGFESNSTEFELNDLPVRGKLPEWLQGTLLRTGPAIFEVGQERFLHWFDGLGALHRFAFKAGKVSYTYRIMQSENYKRDMQAGKITTPQFGTNPRQTIFGKLSNLAKPPVNDNCIVNIARFGEDFTALTETPHVVQFDPRSLNILGAFEFSDKLNVQVQTAHPHYDFARKMLINYSLRLGQACSHVIYGLKDGSHERHLIAEISVKNPTYIHSFAVTENYIILVEFPLFFNLAGLALGLKTFAEGTNWQPNEPTRFQVVRKSDGKLIKTYESAPFFSFHHINAFEENGDIFIDLSAYNDSSIIQALYLDNLRSPTGGKLPTAYYRRYRLPANGAQADYELLCDRHFEIPQLHYARHEAQPYRYAYGISRLPDYPGDFYNQLIKVDTHSGAIKTWQQTDTYPGEPVFVPEPGATQEDAGVNLSEVLDGTTGRSSLLVLDAPTFEELACIELPQVIPFNFHGMFAPQVS